MFARPYSALHAVGLSSMLMLFAGGTYADGATYTIDPAHTYPSFEADHMGGLSVWRGKFNHSSGKVVLDKQAGTGSVDITVDVSSVNFGMDDMNKSALGAELFDVSKYPKAHYQGTLADFVNGAPTRVKGQLTLHGVTRPLDLDIRSFKCMPHPMFKREVCGADAYATFQRDQFGMSAGKDYGFNMDVQLRIQVEALVDEKGGVASKAP